MCDWSDEETKQIILETEEAIKGNKVLLECLQKEIAAGREDLARRDRNIERLSRQIITTSFAELSDCYAEVVGTVVCVFDKNPSQPISASNLKGIINWLVKVEELEGFVFIYRKPWGGWCRVLLDSKGHYLGLEEIPGAATRGQAISIVKELA